jgi:hypothetical protein
MRKPLNHTDQFVLGFGRDSEIERIIEARVAIRAEAEALRWRFRLILIETTMLTTLVLLAGWLLDLSLYKMVRNALFVCAGCLASGLILVVLSGGASMGLSRLMRWRANRAAIRRWTRRP